MERRKLTGLTNAQAGHLWGAMAYLAGRMQQIYDYSLEGLPLGADVPKIAPAVDVIHTAVDEIYKSRKSPTASVLVKGIAQQRKDLIERTAKPYTELEASSALIQELERCRVANIYGIDAEASHTSFCIFTLNKNYTAVFEQIGELLNPNKVAKLQKKLRKMPIL